MITKDFSLDDLEFVYTVGVNQIKIDLDNLIKNNKLKNEKSILDFLINLIDEIQNAYEDTFIQFFSDALILDTNHIYTACYYVQKAFLNNANISKSKNIELLLYLTATRQIKKAIESFGIKISDLELGKLNFCVVSNEENLKNINNDILEKLLASEIEITLNNRSKDKFISVKNFYEFSNKQINCVLNSYGYNSIKEEQVINQIENLFLALYDLICEKMSLLSLEKFKSD